ncbi:MAG: hypothetical protein IKB22_00325 [Lentisphaeria bacterium]|nr:hypothetical protein [Lentisphaeria bacterium]
MHEQFEKEEICFTFPLERPHCGVPLANGNFGALIWGRETLNLTIGQNDLWDHRIGELVDERDSYDRFTAYAKEYGYDSGLDKLFHRDDSFIGRSGRLPIGRFDFHFAEGITPRAAVLHYETGMLDIITSGNGTIRLICVLKQNILYVLDPGREIQSVSLHPASDFPQVRQFNAERGMGEYERLADGWKICPPADHEFTIRAEKTAYGWKIYTNQDSDDTRMEQQIAFTNSWWSSFSARIPHITVPDSWWNRFFRFSQYKFGAATCPFGYPSGLQGPWHEEYQECKWSGDFHFNVNVQMIYGPAFALGVAEHLLPLFDMIESPAFQLAMKHNAKSLFKVDDALWQTHAVDDRGLQCGWLGSWSVLDPACGAWTALLYYDYYRYTNDVSFLRDRAWPYIYGIMRGYECMLDSEFNIPVAISAEYASSNRNMKTVAGRNPSYQLAAIRKLAKILIELAAVLKREERPIWRKILEKVPEFTTVSGYDSYGGKDEQRIAIWENQDLEVCHRHHSHLGCIWPFDSLPENPDPETERILANSIDHWISMGFGKWSEWSIPWANIIFTRMGLNEAPMQLFGIWKEIFVNEGLATVYLPRMLSLIAHRRHDISKPKETNEVMQMDGTCGFLTAFMEMCAYPRFGKLNLFHGMPSKWKDIRVENLTLPGGGILTAERGGEAVISGGVKDLTFSFNNK